MEFLILKINNELASTTNPAAFLDRSGTILACNQLWQEKVRELRTNDQNLFADTATSWPPASCADISIDALEKLKLAISRVLNGESVFEQINTDTKDQTLTRKLTITLSEFNVDDLAGLKVTIRQDPEASTLMKMPDWQRDQLIDMLSEGILIQGKQGEILASNPAAEMILGLSQSQIEGRTHSDPRWGTVHEDGSPCPLDELPSAIAIRTGEPVSNTILGINQPDGSRRWLLVNCKPFYMPGESSPSVTVTSFNDVTEKRVRDKKLHDLSDQLQLVLDVGNIGIWDYDLVNDSLYWDAGSKRILGVEEKMLKGNFSDWEDIVHFDDYNSSKEDFFHALEEQDIYTAENRVVTGSGETRYITTRAKIIRDTNGRAKRVIGNVIDITEQRLGEIALKQRAVELEQVSSKLKLALGLEGIGTWEWNLADNSLWWDDGQYKIYGLSPRKKIDTVECWTKRVHPEDLAEAENAMQKVIAGETVSLSQFRIIRPNGEIRHITGNLVIHRDKYGNPTHVTGVNRDSTFEIEARQELFKLAYYDTLTGLPSRAAIEQKVYERIERIKTDTRCLAIYVLDIDHFRDVNDTFGHIIGDQLLQSVADRLRPYVNDKTTAGRLGGDEFIFIKEVENNTTPEDLQAFAFGLNKTFETPFQLEESIYVSARISIGISLYPEHGDSFMKLFRNADTALFKAKSLGRNTSCLYTQELTTSLTNRILIEQKLENALKNNELTLYYQPITSAKEKRTVALEALTRWYDQDLGWVAPDEFIPLAEQSGLINQLSRWVLTTACEQMALWLKSGLSIETISVNLSGRDFTDSDLASLLESALAKSNLPAKHLGLEITENILMLNTEKTKTALHQLSAMGISLSIDDFGTGYSSLAYLKEFKVHSLKIDRSFVSDLPDDHNDLQIIKAVVSMAQNLGLNTIAEGVESHQQLECITGLGCDQIQGYLVSKPLPAEAIEQFLRANEAFQTPAS